MQREEAVIILEDNHDKSILLLHRFRDLLSTKPILICRSLAAAIRWCEANPEYFLKVFLDYELAPMMGNGMDLLTWLLKFRHPFLEYVYVTTYTPSMQKQMVELCDRYQIPNEVVP